LLLGLALALPAYALAQSAPDAALKQAAGKLAVAVCASCHGAEGRGDDPRVPRLAGQQRVYLEAQLKAFRSQRRNDRAAHEYMWDVAAPLDDGIIAALAEHFAALAPGAGTPPADATAAKNAAAGKAAFERGNPQRGTFACAYCHGAGAEGLAIFPRLAGQHGEYLFIQMQSMRTRLRNNPAMHGAVKDLTDADVIALAAYLQTR